MTTLEEPQLIDFGELPEYGQDGILDAEIAALAEEIAAYEASIAFKAAGQDYLNYRRRVVAKKALVGETAFKLEPVEYRPNSNELSSKTWQEKGACRGTDTETFYSPPNERGPARANREQKAKAICATCPVVAICLEYAERDPFGVWGGQTAKERRKGKTKLSA